VTVAVPETSQRLRAIVGRIVSGLVVVVLTSCSDPDPTASFEIERISIPTPITPAGVTVTTATSITVTTTEQFVVSDDSDVLWGLTESTAPPRAPVFPLEISADGRYLVDQRGEPWRIQADAAWLMSSVATPEEVDMYLDTRRSQGFNSFYLMAMVHPRGYSEAPDAPANHQGDSPFDGEGVFSTAGDSAESQRYWAWIDSIVEKAAARDMVVMLSYSYLGWNGGDMGWYADIENQPNREALFDWGVWLGERYGDDPNIIWFGLGDFAPPGGTEGSLRTVAIADGIMSAGAPQLFMAEPNPPDEIPSEAPDFGAIVDMNSFYGYGPQGIGTVYETADRAWRLNPAIPAWMQEGTYEYENNWGHFSGKPWDTRRGRFWSVLSGGTAGDGFGSRDVWQWNDIPESLGTPGAAYSTYAFELFASMPWWLLEPSGRDPGFTGIDLVVGGEGEWGSLDRVTAARTSDHQWMLAYVPVTEQGPRTIEVDMSALAGRGRARWFDPATGNYIAISDGYEFDNAGTRAFETPGRRDDGTDDWLLVLDSTNAPRCGTISPTGVYTSPSDTTSFATCEVTAALRSDPSVMARRPLDGTG
jgi:hypothetical protein